MQEQTLVCFLVGVLLARNLGLMHSNSAFTCYEGDVTAVTADFPNGFLLTCQAGDGDTACIEKRWKNWETTVGVLQIHMACGVCGRFNASKIECRECHLDRCNADFATELQDVQNINELGLCFASVESDKKIYPEPVLCPRNQSCASGFDPQSTSSILVGCQAHCDKLNWTKCEYCDTDLCNNSSSIIQKQKQVGVASDLARSSRSVAPPSGLVAGLAAVSALMLL